MSAKKTTPTYLKAEFWVTLLTSVSGILLAFGVITPKEASSLSQYLPNVVGAVLALLSSSKFVSTQAAEKVEVFRALCAASLDADGRITAQGVSTPEDRICQIARTAGL